MLNIIESSINNKIKDASSHAHHLFDVNVDWMHHPRSYAYYYTYGATFKPRSILEFGVGFGFSLLSMLSGSDIVEFICGVDDEIYVPNSNQIAENVLRAGGYKGDLRLIKGEINNVILPDRKYDVVSLDSHNINELTIGWKFVADGGYCIIDDLGSSFSICEPNKFNWVLAQVTNLVFTKQVEWYYFVDSFRGQLIIRKKI